MQTFVGVGTAPVTIRDERLYREEYGTFEDYCRDRWGMSRKRSYDMMYAASGVSQICDTDLPTPATESQARELAKAPRYRFRGS